jgi:type IV pilus assembly protein PilW
MHKYNSTYRNISGFSLVEIMIAMIISLVLMGGVIQVFLGSKQSYRTNEGIARMQENIRFAMGRLSEDLSAAGYMGCDDSSGVDIANNLLLVNALDSSSATATSVAYDFGNPITGFDGTGLNGSDSISIRRAFSGSNVPLISPMASQTAPLVLDTAASTNYSSLQKWDTLAVSDCYTTSIFMITNNPTTSGGVIRHDPGLLPPSGHANEGLKNLADPSDNTINDLQTAYGAETASVATAIKVATTTYALCTGTLGTNTALCQDGSILVDGVQDMQIVYGLDSDGTPGVERLVTASSAALTAAGLNSVSNIQITLNMDSVDRMNNGSLITKTITHTIDLRNR